MGLPLSLHFSNLTMENASIASLYPDTENSSSEESDTTYIMDFCDISSGNVMPGTAPYVLRKRGEGIPSDERNGHVYKKSRDLFLKKTGGIGTIVRKLNSSGNGYGFNHISYRDEHLRLKSVTGKKSIHISDITSCKNHGSTLSIYTKDHGVITLIMGSVKDAYAFSTFLG